MSSPEEANTPRLIIFFFFCVVAIHERALITWRKSDSKTQKKGQKKKGENEGIKEYTHRHAEINEHQERKKKKKEIRWAV